MRQNLQFFALLLGLLLLAALALLYVPDSIFPLAGLNLEILWQLRLPRLFTAVLAGAMMAFAGVLVQALFRNPLAEPSLIGVSSGGALGATLCLFLFPAQVLLLPAFAAVGALGAVGLLMLLARQAMRHGPQHLLLMGVALNFSVSALVGVLTFLAPNDVMRSISFWTLGSVAGTEYWQVLLLLFALLSSLVLVAGNWRQLDIWMLGESVARQSGVNTRILLYKIVLALCLCVGTVVAFCGVMGFIGLLIPHAVRLLMGMSHRAVIWASLLAGAMLMLLADMASQLAISRVELPIGLVLAMVGGPLFILLLLRVQKHGWR